MWEAVRSRRRRSSASMRISNSAQMWRLWERKRSCLNCLAKSLPENLLLQFSRLFLFLTRIKHAFLKSVRFSLLEFASYVGLDTKAVKNNYEIISYFNNNTYINCSDKPLMQWNSDCEKYSEENSFSNNTYFKCYLQTKPNYFCLKLFWAIVV